MSYVNYISIFMNHLKSNNFFIIDQNEFDTPKI